MALIKPRLNETSNSVCEERYGDWWRVWHGGGFKLVSCDDAPTEIEAKIQSHTLVPWEIERITGIAYRHERGFPWLMVLEGAQ